ncbi:hypothetical protein D3C80_1535930 [compost metagenome]
MLDPREMGAQHRKRIFSREGQMSGIEQQRHFSRIRELHQPVDFRSRLHTGAHMVMIDDRHAFFGGQTAQLAQAFG